MAMHFRQAESKNNPLYMVFPWTLAVATQEGPNGHERYRASAELCSRYIARKRVEDRLSYDELYVASLSPKTIVYKAWVRTWEGS